jgi:hypothetical protein
MPYLRLCPSASVNLGPSVSVNLGPSVSGNLGPLSHLESRLLPPVSAYPRVPWDPVRTPLH